MTAHDRLVFASASSDGALLNGKISVVWRMWVSDGVRSLPLSNGPESRCLSTQKKKKKGWLKGNRGQKRRGLE